MSPTERSLGLARTVSKCMAVPNAWKSTTHVSGAFESGICRRLASCGKLTIRGAGLRTPDSSLEKPRRIRIPEMVNPIAFPVRLEFGRRMVTSDTVTSVSRLTCVRSFVGFPNQVSRKIARTSPRRKTSEV